ncbi:MAG: YggS family pyridoxal phosphate-dependent enzyme [Desulfomonilaceae bacterium]|nr:YggS family pyridoxal phosphate-dependent enzyme [Desulfomonilaceae bacterium]
MIAERLTEIRARIAQAAARAGRSGDNVRIVAAAKGQARGKIEEALDAGIRLIGHNYLQEAAREMPLIQPPDSEFHMIGHLQRNKAGKAVELFDVIQTVDDERLAIALDRRAAMLDRTIGVLIQVNLSGEPQKSGLPADEVAALIEAIRGLPSLRLMGLMTMPPFFDDPDRARPYFAQLRDLRDSLVHSETLAPDMTELSMGMTGDFEVAVEEGATLVRIGTALFGERM